MNKIVKFLMNYTYVVLKIYGFAPFEYKNGKFKKTKRSIILSMVPTLFVSCIYPNSFHHTVKLNEQVISNTKSLQYGKIYLCLTYATCFLIYIINIMHIKRNVVIINQIKHLYENILYRITEIEGIEVQPTKWKIFLFTLKLIAIPSCFFLALFFKLGMVDFLEFCWLFNCFILPYFIRIALPTAVFGGFLIVKMYLEYCNKYLRNSVNEINLLCEHKDYVENTSKYFKMKEYCQISDQLDKIMYMYNMIYKLLQLIIEFSGPSLLLIFICGIYAIIYQIFTQYILLADSLIDGKTYLYNDVISSILHVIALAVEGFMFTYIASGCVNEIKSSGWILHQIFLDDEMDKRLRNTIEYFSIYILKRNRKIFTYNLFSLENILIFNIFAVSVDYLLIFIQSDLAERYKYK